MRTDAAEHGAHGPAAEGCQPPGLARRRCDIEQIRGCERLISPQPGHDPVGDRARHGCDGQHAPQGARMALGPIRPVPLIDAAVRAALVVAGLVALLCLFRTWRDYQTAWEFSFPRQPTGDESDAAARDGSPEPTSLREWEAQRA